MKRNNPLSALGAWLALALASAPALPGANASSTGAIEGRVLSAASNNYLERVRVTVEDSSLETLTDADGVYRFPAVPAGSARVKFFYTGFPPRTESVAVATAQTTQFDVTLGTTTPLGAQGGVV